MKMMKKVLALVMAMALVLGMAVTTFAKAPGNDGVYGTADDRGTITVNGIAPEEGLTVTAYQIVKAQYGTDGTGSFSGYVRLYSDVNVDETTGNIIVDQDDLNNILSDIRGESPSVDPVSYTMLSDDGTSYSADVPVGTYLVVIEGAETKVYNPVVVSVSYTVTEGDNDLEEGSVDVTDGSAWVKVSDTPTIDKTVSDSNETNVNGNSANVGETVTYNVTINSIPNYGGDYPVLKVVDTLSAGLTYANTIDDPLTVKIGDTVLSVGTDYTLNVEGQTITVDFVVNGEYTLNKYAGQSAVITYKAEVNEQAVVNADGNNNDVDLIYTTDSKTEDHDGKHEDKTYTYTFDIDGKATGTKDIVTKVGEGDDEEALEGAVFGLYTDINCGEDDLYTNDKFTGTVASDDEGQLYITGLAAGTYYLKEISAPEGYSINTQVFTIVIEAEYNQDGTLNNWKITINGQKAATFTVDHSSGSPVVDDTITGVDIKNTKLSSLPSTGGIGTTIFTIGGCAIMIAAASLFFVSRRKSESK